MNTDAVILKSNENEKKHIKDMLLILSFTVAMIISSYIKIPLFPVPITLQTFIVVLSAFVMANRKVSISYILYLLYGLAGAAIFANGGGPSYIFSPTFGYILGFIIMSYIIGFMLENQDKSNIKLQKLILFGFIGVLIQHIIGVVYLYAISHTILDSNSSLLSAIINGSLIFLPYDILKIIIAGIITKQTYK